jgi:hypothetical protein
MMGVSMRMTRHTRLWLPWWLAIPVGLFWLAFMAVFVVLWGLGYVIAGLFKLIHQAAVANAERRAARPPQALPALVKGRRESWSLHPARPDSRARESATRERPAGPPTPLGPKHASRRRPKTITAGFEAAHGIMRSPEDQR